MVTILLLVGAGAAADWYLTGEAEQQVSARVSEALGAPVAVELAGWPVTLRLLTGEVPVVRISAADVSLGEASVRRMDAEVRDVRLRWDDLASGGELPVAGGRGTYTAELDEAAVGALAGFPGALRFGDGLGQLDMAGQSVDVTAGVEDGAITFRPVGNVPPGAEAVSVALPPLPAQATVETVRILPGALRVSGRILELTQPRP